MEGSVSLELEKGMGGPSNIVGKRGSRAWEGVAERGGVFSTKNKERKKATKILMLGLTTATWRGFEKGGPTF